MPCPFFEPRMVTMHPLKPGGRLPLLDEYEGQCHASAAPFEVPQDLRFRYCNHGYSRGVCGHFPVTENRSCARFNLVQVSAEALELLYVEEQNHTPVRWQSVRYFIEPESLEPNVMDACARAQVVAFCRSYLRRFS